jgi:hypothetical protein
MSVIHWKRHYILKCIEKQSKKKIKLEDIRKIVFWSDFQHERIWIDLESEKEIRFIKTSENSKSNNIFMKDGDIYVEILDKGISALSNNKYLNAWVKSWMIYVSLGLNILLIVSTVLAIIYGSHIKCT